MDPFKPIPSGILRMILEILPSRSDFAAATEASAAFRNAADPFESIPSEIRLMILEILPGRSDIAAATQASKAFRNTAAGTSSRDLIRRLHVQKDLSGDLLQAAMAVVLFPGPGSNEALITNHLDDWEHGRFANPFLDHVSNRDRIEKLDNLCGCLRLVITDYLSKATSARLPFAYRALPTWSNPYYAQTASQGDLRQHHLNSFNINNMETDERCRVYRAFLQYEILSKVYGPLAAARAPAGPQPRFHMWDWNSLFHNSIPASDPKLFGSIREYYIMTHRAVLAQLEMDPRQTFRQDPPQHIPEVCEHAPRVGQYEFQPNPRYLVARPQHTDVAGFSVLASGGLDTLVGVLTAQPWTMRTLYLKLWRECKRKHLRFGLALSIPAVDYADSQPSFNARYWLFAGLVRLQRQRAWGVFRDDRFYPRSMASMTQRFRQGMMQNNPFTLQHYRYPTSSSLTLNTYRYPNSNALYRYADGTAFQADQQYPSSHVWVSLNQSRILREAWKRCERRGACSWRIMTE